MNVIFLYYKVKSLSSSSVVLISAIKKCIVVEKVARLGQEFATKILIPQKHTERFLSGE